MKPNGIVNIKGREYTTVAKRIQDFRADLPEYRLVTEVLFRDGECVVVKATILNPKGEVLATGHAEEYREASQINSTSALENCETSAIGRALACFGYGGTEFASADEVANAIHQQAAPRGSARAVTEDAFKSLPKDKQQMVTDTATQVRDYLNENRDWDAYALCDQLDTEEKLAIWSLLDAKARARIKAAKAQEHATA